MINPCEGTYVLRSNGADVTPAVCNRPSQKRPGEPSEPEPASSAPPPVRQKLHRKNPHDLRVPPSISIGKLASWKESRHQVKQPTSPGRPARNRDQEQGLARRSWVVPIGWETGFQMPAQPRLEPPGPLVNVRLICLTIRGGGMRRLVLCVLCIALSLSRSPSLSSGPVPLVW